MNTRGKRITREDHQPTATQHQTKPVQTWGDFVSTNPYELH